MASPNTTMHGTMIRLGLNRSSNRPRIGDAAATVIAAIPNAAEIASLLQPNSAASGFRNTLNVKTRSEPKLTNTPACAASTTRQP